MLFLSDLDGTLMDSNGNVTDEDVECIHQWTQKHAFGFVTGRDRAFCVALASKYQLSCEYMITDNGANAYYKDKNVYSSLLFLYIFFFLRLFSGGYHAPTYSRCFILTNAIFAFVYLLSEVIQWYKPLLIPFAILSCISIFLLSPIRSTKHPLSERLYAQNKKTARIIVSIDFLLFLILYITGMPTRYLATWALSLSAVAIMMVITLFEKNSTRRESV